MKRLLSLISVLLILMTVSIPAVGQETSLSDDIVILYTNDIHTYIDGPLSYDVIAAVKQELQTRYAHVLLVDAGDHIQGTAYGSMDKGATMIQLMNAAGYDLATLGNHEFDYGMEGCLQIIADAKFPYISCNFYHEAEGVRQDNVLNSYTTFTCGEEVVAFVGITTPESFTKSTPAYFQDDSGSYIYGISGGEDGTALYTDVQKAIDEAAAAGATKIIALGHLGDDPGSGPWTSEQAIAHVSGLDAFIDGHSHSIVKGTMVSDKDGEDVLLTQTGEYFDRIGMMVIDSETSEITTGFIECDEVLDTDGKTVKGYTLTSELYEGTQLVSSEPVKQLLSAWISEISNRLDKVIGSADVTLDNYDEEGNRLVRMQETNTGDFCADALYYLFDSKGMDVDVAVMNGGGVRNQAVTGSLTYLTCKQIHTFGNVACLQTVTGQQLLDALEWGARTAGEAECGGFLQVSGLTYRIDCSIPESTGKDEKGVWIGGPTAGYRVCDVKIYNKSTDSWDPLDPEATYNLAGYNYTLRDLGDGFNMFHGAVNVLDYVMEDYMVLSHYAAAFENGVVGAANSPLTVKYPGFFTDYSTVNGSGRIVVDAAVQEDDGKTVIGGLDSDLWFTKYGNVYTDCKTEDFLGSMGFAMGDLVTVAFLEQTLTLPVVPDYSYVDSGTPAIIAHLTETGAPTGYISLAVNMGNFGETYGLAVKQTDQGGNWWWKAAEGVSFPVEVSFEMAQQGGYSDQYMIRSLTRTNDRGDYTHLLDAEFANFRSITTTGMGEKTLYRTSSPINPELNRNTYAQAALEAAGVNVIMNLADSAESAAAYEGYADSYYAKQKVIFLNVGVDTAAPEFKTALADGLRFFAQQEGVYAIHCNEGKDRAGFVSALLECLMGASCQEVIDDYMVTYYNYYGVEPGSEKAAVIAQSNIEKTLRDAFGVEDLYSADLSAEAGEYIRDVGLTDGEIRNLKANLGGESVDTTAGILICAGVSAALLLCAALIIRKKEVHCG